jgi:fatty acid desaturase
MTVLFFQVGMAMDHWSHHRFANTDKDPDVKLLGHFQNFWSRMLFQRNRANRHYFLRSLNLALGRPLPAELKNIRLPFSLETFQKLAWANLACVIGWVAFYLYLNSLFPGLICVMVVIPMLFGAALSGLRSFTEHANTESGDLKDTRSRTHWFLTIVEYGGNYHLEHHLYPSVPQWKLPAVNKWLVQNGHYQHLDADLLEDSLSVYRYATSDHLYGKKTQKKVDALPA